MNDFNVEEVLEKLTIFEKIGLLAGIDFWHTFPVERLDIPSLRMSDGPNGTRGTKFFDGVPAACFPCGTGLAATFNKDLLVKAGKLMGVEAKHKGSHIILGPTTNMQRGPLGGRGFESFSEDPYLAGQASVSIIKGIQDEDIAATIKHFVCNDLEDQRNSSDSILSERALREIYLEPFRLAVKYSDPKCFMTAYNKVNGTHVSNNKKILDDILRKEWGWDGLIMSDWFGTYTTKAGIEAGLDIEMPGPTIHRGTNAVKHMIDSKELHISDLDARVKNVLNLIKFCKTSGVPGGAPEDTENNTPETSKTLLDVAKESIVLLKNEDNILPLKKDEKIAVIGPNAKYAAYCGGGSAALRPYYTTSPYQGIVKKAGSDVAYTVGAYAHKSLPSLSNQLINPDTKETGYKMKFFKKPAEHKGDREQFDEYDYDFSFVFLADYKSDKIDTSLYYVDIEGDFTAEEDGDYEFGLTVQGTALLYVDGKLIVDNKTKQEKGEAFFNAGSTEKTNTTPLKKGQTYRVRVEFGSAPTFTAKTDDQVDFGGGGGLFFGCAKVIDADEEIKKAAELAKSVDKVVLSIGLNQEWESEGYDRENMELPLRTNDLVAAVLKANPNTVIVNQSGTPVEMPWIKDAKALVQAWYGGNEGGNAIAEILFGDYNPSGKLSLSFPFKNIDNPAYLNFKTEAGRVLYGEDIFIGYRYYEKLQKSVAFPFGFGLSFTDYEYSNLKVSVDEASDKLEASVDVKNVGKIDGDEVVQLYVRHNEPTIIKPVKELKGFEKVSIKAGSSVTVKFSLSLKDSVSYFNEYHNKWHVEKGDYEVQVGKSSDDIELIEKFEVTKEKFWLGL
ncbi:putative probable beta-glucosidase I [[Candida] jaroonii]|uniref:Probable beta-glucosidase I n=1 Tax=[Candida] jaroonii TaxID=467808 RepID=A0ACA9Y8S1_9ASCO|nr:putative probable beta-glucosidase I [[Candida] jaroonii]